MPKLKTNRAAAKRFRKTANGFKSYSAGRRHNLGHKPRKTKRQLRSGGSSLVHESDVGRLSQLLPNHSKRCDSSGVDKHMARVKRGVTAGRRHKKVLGKAKGYYNARRKVFRAAKQAVIKAGQYAYPRPSRSRSAISARCGSQRINAAARAHGLSLQPPDQRPEDGADRDRPQDARRPRGATTLRPSASSPAGQGCAEAPER